MEERHRKAKIRFNVMILKFYLLKRMGSRLGTKMAG